MAGWWKVFDLGPYVHAQNYFAEGFAGSWIPAWGLWTLGVTIPWLELAAGILLLIGSGIRAVLYALGILLLITAYGHALQQPLFDIDGHKFTRLALCSYFCWSMAGATILRRRNTG